MSQQLLEAPWRQSPKGAIYASLEELKKYASTADIAKQLEPTDKFKKTIGDFTYSVKVWDDGRVSVFKNKKDEQQSKTQFKSKPPIKFVEYIFSRTELLKFINDNPTYEYVGTQAYRGKIGTEFVTIMGTRTIPPMPDLNKNDHGNESLASIKGNPQDQEESYDEIVGEE